MPKFVLHHGENEFHFQLGRHGKRQPDEIRAKDLDALVLEEYLEDDPQAKHLVEEMKRQNKPVYYVESEELLKKVGGVLSAGRIARTTGILTAGLAFLKKSREKKQVRLGKKEAKISRRTFLRLATAGGGLWGLGLLASTDFGRMLPTGQAAPKEPRSYTKEELDMLPNDIKSGMIVARRNAVIAEGLATLAKQHRRIGIVSGSAHYNIPDYILDPALRKRVRAGYEPSIRKIH
ncbi:TPA: twin-arginine translocation signal domain-containing protein [Candidatus Micrarchaeota archaeon]|nr:twin-arginine translocation signal domain-containing protein [Candidatus Micrarchaeota archaeon]